MSMTVNKADNGIVKKMALAGVTTGTLVGLHKAGKLNTQAADEFISSMGKAVKNRDGATLKNGFNTILDKVKIWSKKYLSSCKKFWEKDSTAKKEFVSNKAKSLWEKTREFGNKTLEAGKDFWAKDLEGKKAVAKEIWNKPSTKWFAGITAGFIAAGFILKGIKNHIHNKKEA